jgi:hypothetical protein
MFDYQPKRVRSSLDLATLCSAWNHATNPRVAMGERDHQRSNRHARAIRNRIRRAGYALGRDIKELSNGSLIAVRSVPYVEVDREDGIRMSRSIRVF